MPRHFLLGAYSSRRLFTLSLLLANPGIVCNLRMMSIQDQEVTDPLLFMEAQQALIERLIAAKILEAASTSTATSTSDITVSSVASVIELNLVGHHCYAS